MIQHCPTPTELDDLELLASGAYAPITRFNEPGSVVTLALPEGAEEAELVDPEGLPLARVDAAGTVTPLTHAQYGPFRGLHLTPAQARERYAGATFVPVTDALTTAELDELRELGKVVLVALMGTGTAALSPVALVRATLAAAAHIGAEVVAVPMPSHGDADADHALGAQVLSNYAGEDPVHALSTPRWLSSERSERVETKACRRRQQFGEIASTFDQVAPATRPAGPRSRREGRDAPLVAQDPLPAQARAGLSAHLALPPLTPRWLSSERSEPPLVEQRAQRACRNHLSQRPDRSPTPAPSRPPWSRAARR